MDATSWLETAFLAASLGAAVAFLLLIPVGVGFHVNLTNEARVWLLLSIRGKILARVCLSRPNHRSARGSKGPTGQDGPEPATKANRSLIDRTTRTIGIVQRVYHIVRPALRTIERLEWRTEVGAGDAAATGLLAGAFWALKGAVVGFLLRDHRFLEPPKLWVAPFYRDVRLALEIRCIFRLRLGDIIRAAMRQRPTQRE
ncbi:MAG TPA: DUF2953 domain-containing protein [Limnochordia bacterium]|nr:DUF2953 domain-containing protein [Limnochordia bacterium]